MSESNVQLCIDCKNLAPPKGFRSECLHSEAQRVTVSLVDGERRLRRERAATMRFDGRECGPDAALFEARIPEKT